MRRIALVYAKDASRLRAGMDLIRWAEMGRQFASLGWQVHLLTNQPAGVREIEGLEVSDTTTADWDRYHAVKVCYPHSIDLVPAHPCVIVRMCRVVDERRPARDSVRRSVVLRQQQRVCEIARYAAFNDRGNVRRWRSMYGDRQETLIVPTGCPEFIPPETHNPFRTGRRVVLFCGSLTAPRFVAVLNGLADRLRSAAPDVDVHFVGRNRLHVYEASELKLNSRLIKMHAPVDVREAWQYIFHADVGLALAPSADTFECELAKIYYYLRAGLPVVTESKALNRALVEETGHGAIARYDDMDDLVGAVLSALELSPRCMKVMRYMAATHSWRQRAEVYETALESRRLARSAGPS